MNTVLKACNIRKQFDASAGTPVLHGIDLAIQKGEFVSIVGKSGCGKSMLLYILSTMDTDYEGELFLEDERLTGQSQSFLARIRNEKIGFVFQFHYLLNEFSVLRNIMIPALRLGRLSYQEIEDKANGWLSALGLEKLSKAFPRNLSGGEKQRVAIARALINDPLIIMGDEPTGNLDKKNSENVYSILSELSTKQGQTMLIVTHDLDFAQKTTRIIEMEDGHLVSRT
ncbi:MAG TPA: ABC transporter ATP-binding protein [Flavisolibacter sp.]|jgi:lipoprotein-releasing system ATP-binding protein|nr:ABC transporter ATP-binding protein [Flavisolibacter sp.]